MATSASDLETNLNIWIEKCANEIHACNEFKKLRNPYSCPELKFFCWDGLQIFNRAYETHKTAKSDLDKQTTILNGILDSSPAEEIKKNIIAFKKILKDGSKDIGKETDIHDTKILAIGKAIDIMKMKVK